MVEIWKGTAQRDSRIDVALPCERTHPGPLINPSLFFRPFHPSHSPLLWLLDLVWSHWIGLAPPFLFVPGFSPKSMTHFKSTLKNAEGTWSRYSLDVQSIFFHFLAFFYVVLYLYLPVRIFYSWESFRVYKKISLVLAGDQIKLHLVGDVDRWHTRTRTHAQRYWIMGVEFLQQKESSLAFLYAFCQTRYCQLPILHAQYLIAFRLEHRCHQPMF